MKNFKEIAEKCLAGELSGTFVFQNGQSITSNKLRKFSKESLCDDYPYYFKGVCTLDHYGFGYNASYNIINFILDRMKEQIKIDIPEGKVPVMEQTENGVVITWKENELTYGEIYESLWKSFKLIHHITNTEKNEVSNLFIRKTNAIRKLINIRNYFGKPFNVGSTGGWVISSNGTTHRVTVETPHSPVFSEKVHAEQAIKILGDELKYLFEPW